MFKHVFMFILQGIYIAKVLFWNFFLNWVFSSFKSVGTYRKMNFTIQCV